MDDLLKELNKFRGKFPKELVMYYPYPAQKEALAKGEIKLYRNDGGGIDGYVWVKNLKTKGVSRIEEIYSLKRGLGSIMMEDAKRFAAFNTIELKVLDFNERAIGFYLKHGFTEVSREEGKKKNNILMRYIKGENKEQLTLF